MSRAAIFRVRLVLSCRSPERIAAWRSLLSDDKCFPIIGIGASAGGIEALQGLFDGLPTDLGVGYVVVTHLSPDRESVLNEIVGRYTGMPVHVAEEGMAVQPDHVYVLPAGTVLGLADGCLHIHRPSHGRRERKPIDIFLSELAIDRGHLAGGIILSGGDSDGTLGIKAIKERGGVTMAQIANGTAPQYPDMPDSAIRSGMVDFAVPLEDMGTRVADLYAAWQRSRPRSRRMLLPFPQRPKPIR